LSIPWEVTTTSGNRVRTALSSYLGVSGTTSRNRDGILYTNSQTQLVHVPDGTSNTLLLGERPPSADLIYGWWYVGAGQGAGRVDSHLGVVELNVRGTGYRNCPTGPYRFQDDGIQAPCATFHYWSLHAGGSHFALADGSVRFIRYPAVAMLPALATRAGGEVAVID
jgi:prepilin-type processing-associated H-X9-DG protein